MENSLFEWLPSNPTLFGFISIVLNIIIAISGILPSTIVTVSTIGFFGSTLGLIILIVGEAIGAILSFVIYRKGVIKLSRNPKINDIGNRYLYGLKNADGIRAFFMVLLLRIVPFVPSGAVTFTAAISKIGWLSFVFSSTLGKIPALFIETFSANYIIDIIAKWSKESFIFILLLFIWFLLSKHICERKIKK